MFDGWAQAAPCCWSLRYTIWHGVQSQARGKRPFRPVSHTKEVRYYSLGHRELGSLSRSERERSAFWMAEQRGVLQDLKMTDCKGYELGAVARVHMKDIEDCEDFFVRA